MLKTHWCVITLAFVLEQCVLGQLFDPQSYCNYEDGILECNVSKSGFNLELNIGSSRSASDSRMKTESLLDTFEDNKLNTTATLSGSSSRLDIGRSPAVLGNSFSRLGIGRSPVHSLETKRDFGGHFTGIFNPRASTPSFPAWLLSTIESVFSDSSKKPKMICLLSAQNNTCVEWVVFNPSAYPDGFYLDRVGFAQQCRTRGQSVKLKRASEKSIVFTCTGDKADKCRGQGVKLKESTDKLMECTCAGTRVDNCTASTSEMLLKQ
ncbi:LANO_0H00980g1_1 [Lachancea nothofagi CBS 11611]|uniref:LANO_0H00980g1_1 n=1 Tax=Lachancea nothofagi CBS 11611 TaxID=1266666 RepID=A0A1G4KL00_9SACH|nr:LANO_0H00980g1_1 [Lachancea nothofagi CBS 11611]